MYILGISAFYHDSAACKNGEIIAAAQEEPLSKKHDAGFPHHAILLKEAGIAAEDIDNVVFYEKPFVKLKGWQALPSLRQRVYQLRESDAVWIKDKLFQKSALIKELKSTLDSVNWRDRLLFSEHPSHAASAYPSPFDSAAVLTLDGVGEWTTTSLAIGKVVIYKL